MDALAKLKTEPVDKIFKDCVVPRSKYRYADMSVPGITSTGLVFFDFFTIEGYREVVTNFVNQLPRSFSRDQGDSFNNTNKNHRGSVWCRDEAYREKLVQLAIGLDLIEIIEPRELWAYLPRQRPNIRIVQK